MAVIDEKLTRNPFTGLGKTFHYEPAEKAPLSLLQVRRLFALATDGNSAGKLSASQSLFTRVLIPTSVRGHSLGQVRFDQFDLDAGTWRVPAASMKMGVAFTVSLPKQAVETLRAAPRKGPVLFPVLPGRVRLKQAVGRLLAADGPFPEWTLHSLRHAFASGVNELRDADERPLVDFGISDLCLSHARPESSKISRTYDKSVPKDLMKKCWQLWADEVCAGDPGDMSRFVVGVGDLAMLGKVGKTTVTTTTVRPDGTETAVTTTS